MPSCVRTEFPMLRSLWSYQGARLGVGGCYFSCDQLAYDGSLICFMMFALCLEPRTFASDKWLAAKRPNRSLLQSKSNCISSKCQQSSFRYLWKNMPAYCWAAENIAFNMFPLFLQGIASVSVVRHVSVRLRCLSQWTDSKGRSKGGGRSVRRRTSKPQLSDSEDEQQEDHEQQDDDDVEDGQYLCRLFDVSTRLTPYNKDYVLSLITWVLVDSLNIFTYVLLTWIYSFLKMSGNNIRTEWSCSWTT